MEIPPFDVAPLLREGEGATLSDIRPTCKRRGRSDQRSIKGGNPRRHPGSFVILYLCGTVEELMMSVE